jgi:hypothetical protein
MSSGPSGPTRARLWVPLRAGVPSSRQLNPARRRGRLPSGRVVALRGPAHTAGTEPGRCTPAGAEPGRYTPAGTEPGRHTPAGAEPGRFYARSRFVKLTATSGRARSAASCVRRKLVDLIETPL